MQDRNAWEIEHLKKDVEEQRRVSQDHETRLRSQESFRDSTVEKLITIFNRLDELQEGDRWIKRVFITSLVTGVTGAVISFIVWAIQN